MIVVLKREATEKQIEEMIEFLEKTGIQVHRFTGTSTTVLGLIGDTSTISSDDIEKKQIVESVKKVQTPYKRVSRSFHNTDSKLMEAIRGIPFDFCQKSLLKSCIYLSLPLICCHMPHT